MCSKSSATATANPSTHRSSTAQITSMPSDPQASWPSKARACTTSSAKTSTSSTGTSSSQALPMPLPTINQNSTSRALMSIAPFKVLILNFWESLKIWISWPSVSRMSSFRCLSGPTSIVRLVLLWLCRWCVCEISALQSGSSACGEGLSFALGPWRLPKDIFALILPQPE